MPAIEIDIEVFCDKCGEGLCNQTSVGHTTKRGQPYFSVEPCKKCLKNIEEESYKKGYEDCQKECDK